MADDEKAVKEGQVPADPPAVKPSDETFKQATAPRFPIEDPASEWTVSDSRGPLSTAETEKAAGDFDAPPPLASGPPSKPEAADPKEMTEVRHALLEIAGANESPDTPHLENSAKTDTKRNDQDTQPAQIAQEVKRPLLPIAAGIVIGAAIGAGSAAFVYRSVQNDVVSDEVVRLSSRVDALEKRPGSDTTMTALKQKVADLDSKIAGLGKEGDTAPPDLSPFEAKIAALRSDLDALKARSSTTNGLDSKLARIETVVAGIKTQSSSAEAGVAEMQGQQKQLAGKVMVPALAVVADSLVQQIDQGQPYSSQVDALAALGADPAKIAVLRQNALTGVPSAKILATKFEPLAEPLTATVHQTPANAGFVERLKNGMMGLVSVRRADDLSGSDPASRVARIRADLAHDDVTAALVVWDGFPAEAKMKGEAWRALAKAYADAMGAARGLQQEAITALGGKKL